MYRVGSNASCIFRLTAVSICSQLNLEVTNPSAGVITMGLDIEPCIKITLHSGGVLGEMCGTALPSCSPSVDSTCLLFDRTFECILCSMTGNTDIKASLGNPPYELVGTPSQPHTLDFSAACQASAGASMDMIGGAGALVLLVAVTVVVICVKKKKRSKDITVVTKTDVQMTPSVVADPTDTTDPTDKI